MPTVTISASDAQRLPSPIQLVSWLDEWSPVRWSGPVINGNVATYQVTGLTVQAVEDIVQGSIESYNQTQPGNDEVSFTVSA